MPRRPSYKDIAQRLGVSQMTVSLAMRGHPSIPSATRERVLAAARDIGYRPDPEVARLMNYIKSRGGGGARTGLAVLNFWPNPRQLGRSVYGRALLDGLRARAEELGYAPDILWAAQPGLKPESVRRILQARGIRCLILPVAPVESAAWNADFSGFSVVATSRIWEPLRLHSVIPNHTGEMRLALERIRGRGFHRVGLVLDREADTRSDHLWMAAFLQSQLQTPERYRIEPLLADTITAGVLKDWLRRNNPEVVVSPLNPVKKLLDRIAAPGGRHEKPPAFVTLNWTESVPEFTGVSLNPRQVGAVAVDILHVLDTHNQRGVPENRIVVQVEPYWVEGTTLER